jgi:hypothetical protein
MTKKEYETYKSIALKICKNDERTEDLFHDVLIQLSTNTKFTGLTGSQKTFFFVKSISNQYYSNNSYFYRQYKKFQYTELHNTEQKDEEYEEKPTLEWVQEELDKELKNNEDFWYNKGLFEMYLKHKKLETIHKLTTIPKYSIRQTIKEMKAWLNKKWEDYGKIG